MTEPLDPAARWGLKLGLVLLIILTIGQTLVVLVTVVRLAAGDVENVGGAVGRIVFGVLFVVSMVWALRGGRRRLRDGVEVARHPSAGV